MSDTVTPDNRLHWNWQQKSKNKNRSKIKQTNNAKQPNNNNKLSTHWWQNINIKACQQSILYAECSLFFSQIVYDAYNPQNLYRIPQKLYKQVETARDVRIADASVRGSRSARFFADLVPWRNLLTRTDTDPVL